MLAVVLATVTLLGAGPPASPALATRECRDVVLRTGDGSVYTRTHRLRARRTGCVTARRVARRFLHAEGAGTVRPLGFRCRSRDDGVSCRKGRTRVWWVS